jgi:hypothetical protein
MIVLAKSDEAFRSKGACPSCGNAESVIDAAHFERSAWVVTVDDKPVLESVRPSIGQARAALGDHWKWPPGELEERWKKLAGKGRVAIVPVRIVR